MSTGLTNTHTTRGLSDLYHVFARKQCILCSALRHGCLTSYIDSRCFLPLEQSRTALLGYCLAASQLFARLPGNYFLGGQENITWPRCHNSNSSKSNFHPYRHFLWNCFTLRIYTLAACLQFFLCMHWRLDLTQTNLQLFGCFQNVFITQSFCKWALYTLQPSKRK